jgi:hypothetical protein
VRSVNYVGGIYPATHEAPAYYQLDNKTNAIFNCARVEGIPLVKGEFAVK